MKLPDGITSGFDFSISVRRGDALPMLANYVDSPVSVANFNFPVGSTDSDDD